MGSRSFQTKGHPNGEVFTDANGNTRIALYNGTAATVARGNVRRIGYDSTNNRLAAVAPSASASQQQVLIAAEPCAATGISSYYIKGSNIYCADSTYLTTGTFTLDYAVALNGGKMVCTGAAFAGNANEFGAVSTAGTSTCYIEMFGTPVFDLMYMTKTQSSQTTENNTASFSLVSDSTYVSGSDVSYSQGYGSAVVKAAGTFSGATGGCHGILSIVDWDVACASSSSGVVGLKSIVRSTDVSPTDGYFYAGQFVARKDGSGLMGKQVACVALEAWFYETGTGEIGTAIGGNFGYHCDSTDAGHETGSVHRGVQIFCDNGGTSDAAETTALCLWNMAGTQDNAINVTQSGSGFTNLFYFAAASAPVAANTHSIDDHALQHILTVNVAGDTGYIPVFASIPA